MPRNKKVSGKRYNIPAETLERARAEMRGDISTPVPDDVKAAAKADLAKATPEAVKAAAKGNKRTVQGGGGIRRVPTVDELREQYSYVGQELRNLAVVATVLFAVIIVAAVVLPR
jgi:phosphoribosylformimino-5-aminoimidazole carboxamide ribonucleotide (ProFAR) isomerase